MPPRLSIRGICRSLAPRSRPQNQAQQPSIAAAFARHLTDDVTPSPKFDGVASSASSIPGLPASMMRPGEFPPPSQMKAEDVQMGEPTQEEQAILDLQMAAHGLDPQEYNGLKFEEPPMPQDKLPRAKYHMRYRYDEGVSQLTKLLMRHGKLGKAQNDMAMVLNYLRTSPAPKLNPQRALLPGAPPPEHLPLNPELYLILAVDSVAPLVRLRGFAGLAGGGKALEIPVPMSKRSRRREAFAWIMETVNKKYSMGSGKKQLAHRIGEEIVAVVEGKSAVWGKRDMRHKLGTSVRANLNSPVVMKKGLS